MKEYDYREAVKNDVMEYVKNEIDFSNFDTLEELEDDFNEAHEDEEDKEK